jgi:hypothetical protein
MDYGGVCFPFDNDYAANDGLTFVTLPYSS